MKSAEKELDKLPKTNHKHICNKILSLEQNPRPHGIKKLRHKEEYRLRIGDYRILYTIDDLKKIITIIAVGHRREIYR